MDAIKQQTWLTCMLNGLHFSYVVDQKRGHYEPHRAHDEIGESNLDHVGRIHRPADLRKKHSAQLVACEDEQLRYVLLAGRVLNANECSVW